MRTTLTCRASLFSVLVQALGRSVQRYNWWALLALPLKMDKKRSQEEEEIRCQILQILQAMSTLATLLMFNV